MDLQIIQQRLDTLEMLIEELSQDIADIHANTGITKKRHAFRKINADPRHIAVIAYLMLHEGLSVRHCSQLGLLSYNKVVGLRTWSEDYLHQFLSDYGVLDIYQMGRNHPKFSEIIHEKT